MEDAFGYLNFMRNLRSDLDLYQASVVAFMWSSVALDAKKKRQGLAQLRLFLASRNHKFRETYDDIRH